MMIIYPLRLENSDLTDLTGHLLAATAPEFQSVARGEGVQKIWFKLRCLTRILLSSLESSASLA